MQFFTKTFFAYFLLISLMPFDVWGATNTFPVTTFVGNDTTAPTIPANLTATGVSTSQIDLSWNASSDDFLLSGYHVWRDDVRIATTTATTYSDTGLTASTSYLYYVTAFDSVFNESGSSTAATGTTLANPPPAATTTSSTPSSAQYGSRLRRPEESLKVIEILPQKDSVLIRYETDPHIRSVIKWGTGDTYELGSILERALSLKHETRIIGLAPGTTYTFTIEGENRLGRYGTVFSGTFTTLPPDDVFPPSNVLGLTAIRDGDRVVLNWQNPADQDFSKVRVVRSDRFFPIDIADGWVVYEGDATRAQDNIIDTNVPYLYYTVFSYDVLGNISSGAVVSVRIRAGEMGEASVPETVYADPEKNGIELSFSDLSFMQEGIARTVRDGTVSIDGSKQLTISLPYDRVPQRLKTILVTLKDPEYPDRTFRFLLRSTADHVAYTSTLAPLGRSGEFPLILSVFDYETEQIGYAAGTLISEIRAALKSNPTVPIIENFFEFASNAYLFWFILLLIALAIMGRKLMHEQTE